jgi:hypothetical protein
MTNEIETGRFEQRAREVFDASVDGLDAAARSRLNQARQAATAELEHSHRSRWRTWVPAGAVAAVALAAVMLWHPPGGGELPAQQAQATADPTDAAEILAAGDDLDLASEDLDFYEFAVVATDEPGRGVG